ncbi:molybdopterin-binding oxidoreductase, partial [Streptomyces sp. NPDC059873]
MATVSDDLKVPTPEGGSPGRTARLVRAALGALSGLITGASALAVAELAAVAVRPEAGPVNAVGGAFIDRTPPWLKDFAVRNFGTNDKLVLQLGILALLAVFAMAVGVVALRHRPTGFAAVLVFGAVGAAAAVERPGGGPLDALPSAVGAVLACGVLQLLAGRLTFRPSPAAEGADGTPDATAAADGAPAGSFDRRGFVIAATAAVAASAGAGVLGSRLGGSGAARAAATRAGIVLPAPASPARPVPAGAELRVRGLGPFTTPAK